MLGMGVYAILDCDFLSFLMMAPGSLGSSVDDSMVEASKGHKNAESMDDPSFLHIRNKTGMVDGSDPPTQHWGEGGDIGRELWHKYSQEDRAEDVSTLQKAFVKHSITTLARAYFNMDSFAAYQALAHTTRDTLIHRWNDTQQYHTKQDVKRIYYLSLEFLMGRSLDNALLNLELKGKCKTALQELGFRLEDLIDQECDAALGNGGLGRLAACFMDSLATGNYPAWGYGLRYTYGIFQQKIIDGYQTEFPDYWLTFDNPWEVPRLDVVYEVRFYGSVERIVVDDKGSVKYLWIGGETLEAVAYDVPIPGFRTNNTVNIRLWSSKPKREFDIQSFNQGNYQASVEEQQRAEYITSVLYPNDNTMQGKELRLKQQYFFVCATLKDIIRRFKKLKLPWKDFPTRVAIQLNDTHPALGIPELMRLLIDVEGLQWDEAWNIVTQVYSFTNHTVLPEAMERWPVSMLKHMLPRHMMIIYDINLFFLQSVESIFPNDLDRLARMSIIEEGPSQQVCMAHLAIVGSHTVNGVAEIHSHLLKTTVFKDFVEYYGALKFVNKTNGITPRRWLHQSNPLLSELITERLASDKWVLNLGALSMLRASADDAEFQEKWWIVKHANKLRLAKYIKDVCQVTVSPHAMFDVQVKRIHEYKRQFMNILGVISKYHKIKQMSLEERAAKLVPRVVIFGGKAAPGYAIAKLVIKLINMVADTVNHDPEVFPYLSVIFIPNYNVSLAEIIIPASDISQHISTAGTEASGTSNMKFVLNGGLILGTMDGANVEIREEIGDENIFVFGCLAEEVPMIRHNQRFRQMELNSQLSSVITLIQTGKFGPADQIRPLLDTLTIGGDYYLISHDFVSYLEAQDRVDDAFKDKPSWARKSIISSASMGKFSSDRTIDDYAEKIWNIKRYPVPS
jgi:starch phosphorylase